MGLPAPEFESLPLCSSHVSALEQPEGGRTEYDDVRKHHEKSVERAWRFERHTIPRDFSTEDSGLAHPKVHVLADQVVGDVLKPGGKKEDRSDNHLSDVIPQGQRDACGG